MTTNVVQVDIYLEIEKLYFIYIYIYIYGLHVLVVLMVIEALFFFSIKKKWLFTVLLLCIHCLFDLRVFHTRSIKQNGQTLTKKSKYILQKINNINIY